jgi:hypothetical protein
MAANLQTADELMNWKMRFLIFPVPVKKFPDLQNIFPVNLRRELCKNSLQRSGFSL